MIKKILAMIFIFIVITWLGLSKNQSMMPTINFRANFCNFPQVWQTTKGENATAGIVYHQKDPKFVWEKWASYYSPEAKIERIEPTDFQEKSEKLKKFHALLILEEIPGDQFKNTLAVIKHFISKGVSIILPAYFGPMKENHDYTSWRTFVKNASQLGAIIVGPHSKTYQLGNLSFWKEVPVDIFVLNERIEGQKASAPDGLITRNLEDSSYVALAAIALLKSKHPHLTPQQVKEVIHDRSRSIIWAHIEVNKEQNWVRPFLSKNAIEEYLKRFESHHLKLVETYTNRSLDAGLLLGIPPMGRGEWSMDILNVADAQKMATGKGIVVAILDHMFVEEDPALKNRIFKPGSVIDGVPVYSTKGHGVWMAEDLIKVAPDVKIMPVRICDDNSKPTDNYAKGIDYAVKNGAHIISLSHRAMPKEKMSELDQAIENATQKGVTFVYINYYGNREDVVKSGAIDFARYHKEKCIYVIGTNFINESSFPFTWGVSQTAPLVSGVIAMMKEVKPKLTPLQIKEILLKSNNKNPEGFPLLDAQKAVENAKKLTNPKN